MFTSALDFTLLAGGPTNQGRIICIDMDRNLISQYANEINCLFVDFETAGYSDINSLLSACLNKNTPLETAEKKTISFTKMGLVKAGMQSEKSPFCETPNELINEILQLYMRLESKTQPFAFFEPKIDSNSFMFKVLSFAENIKQSVEIFEKNLMMK